MPQPRRGAATRDTVERDVVACDLLQTGPVFVTLGRELIINLQSVLGPGRRWRGPVECAQEPCLLAPALALWFSLPSVETGSWVRSEETVSEWISKTFPLVSTVTQPFPSEVRKGDEVTRPHRSAGTFKALSLAV